MPALLCPDCRLPLAPVRFGPLQIYACRSCGGGWFPDGALRTIAAAGHAVVRKLAEQMRSARRSVPPSPGALSACPQCLQPLVSNPSATLTGVELRACIPCKAHWAPMRALQLLAFQLAGIRQDDRPLRPNRSQCRESLPSWKVTGVCPRCLGDRQRVEVAELAIEACSDCGGAWLDDENLASLPRMDRGDRAHLLASVKRVRSGRMNRPQRELACPACGIDLVPSSGKAPSCSKCRHSFVDFYSLPDFLELTRQDPPTPSSLTAAAASSTNR